MSQIDARQLTFIAWGNRFVILVLVIASCLATSTRLSAQTEVDIPAAWRSGFAEGWTVYRCQVKLPEAWRDHPLDLFVEGADDARQVNINGQQIVRLGEFPPNYRSGLGGTGRYGIKTEIVKYGEWNSIEVRVFRDRGREHFNVAALALFTDTEAIHLAGKWQAFREDRMLGEGELPGDSFAFDRVEPSADVTNILQRVEGDRGKQNPIAATQLLQPDQGLDLTLVLSDPIIGQPLSMKWDERGRLWVAEYRQYPDPVGLKVISRDPFLRTVYDRVPLAPPNHEPGLDRISIHEDTDGDGTYDHHQVFVDGLNLATSFAIGHGGVYVLNPPYLLFYPDRDHDDVPDGDPTVLLRGFGLEDSHSIANSLRFGPDGWLYGAQGSTVSAEITVEGVDAPAVRSIGQLIWRFQPVAKRFEIFAEGGGNTFGIEIDARGDIFSGHNGGDTRGFHYVQGGYLQKGFSKHGELSNPYAFGYFSWIQHQSVPRFTHTFVIDEGGLFPEPWRGRLFGVEPLQGRVVMSSVAERGSTYQTQDVGFALRSDDSWFRPVDIQSGPDGGIYVADFYEQRIDHASHYQGRIDRESGRIYRLGPISGNSLPPFSFDDSDALLQALTHPNRWVRQTAVKVIGDEPQKIRAQDLRQLLNSEGDYRIDLFWGLYATGAMTSEDWLSALRHRDADVRRWAVRLIGDDYSLHEAEVIEALIDVAARETNVRVRSQIASTARRMSVAVNLRIVQQLVLHQQDANDPYLPLLTWWAIESVCAAHPNSVIEMASQPSFADSPLAKRFLLERIMRRFSAPGDRQSLRLAAQLLSRSPSDQAAERLLIGFDQAMTGRSLGQIPEELATELLKRRPNSLELKVLLGQSEAIDSARKQLASEELSLDARLSVARVLAARRSSEDLTGWLNLLTPQTPKELRSAALAALMDHSAPQVASQILDVWSELSESERVIAQTTLASRLDWAKTFLASIQAGKIEATQITVDTARRMSLHRDETLRTVIQQIWPNVDPPADQSNDQLIADLTSVVVAGNGNPYDGRNLFSERCAKCHKLFGSGGDLGPELTGFQRTDLNRLLSNVVTPSLEIREGYTTQVVETSDGLLITGFLESQDEAQLVIRQADGRAVSIETEAIVDRYDSPQSLMPNGLLDGLNEQQLRDLFAYLRSAQPLP